MNESYTIITGGLGGLGSAFALECASRGRDIILIDKFNDGAEIIDYLKSHLKVSTQYISCDLSDQHARSVLIKNMDDHNIKINGLINVVGQEIEGQFLTRTRDEILYMLHLNVEAMIDLTLASLKRADPDQRFFLVNIASLAGFFPMPYKAIYSSTKRFIINFSLGLREEIRDIGNVTVLCPGGLPTNAEAIKKIYLQGFWGKMTAHDTSRVVQKTMQKVEHNIPLYIPGIANKLLVWISHLLPEPWMAAYLVRRWGKKQADLDLWRLVEKNKNNKLVEREKWTLF